jgi:hypothetical protein
VVSIMVCTGTMDLPAAAGIGSRGPMATTARRSKGVSRVSQYRFKPVGRA